MYIKLLTDDKVRCGNTHRDIMRQPIMKCHIRKQLTLESRLAQETKSVDTDIPIRKFVEESSVGTSVKIVIKAEESRAGASSDQPR